jgi:GNAT superfamily N-acetyltransferase
MTMTHRPDRQGELTLRRAKAEDASLLAQIHVDAWRAAYRGLVPDEHLAGLDPTSRADSWGRFLSEGLAETYVAVLDGKAVGFITFAGCRDESADAGETGEIWGIYLRPDSWRMGVGRKLCRFAEQSLESRGYGVAVLWVFEGNTAARRFYEVWGYHIDGATKTIDAGAPLWAVRYRKTIRRVKRVSPGAASSIEGPQRAGPGRQEGL